MVGFLFARNREERERFSPAERPRYTNPKLDPYRQATGVDEDDDSFHYGYSLIREIQRAPRQELATHTFSHFVCLESGATKEAFRADLEAARSIMASIAGVTPRSIVFPRNEHNPAFDDVLVEAGITCYRGNQTSWMWKPGENRPLARIARLADAYAPVAGTNTFEWADAVPTGGLSNVRASFLVRPRSRGLRLRRILSAMRYAAKHDRLIHLCWHPHNFGVNTDENLAMLGRILGEYARLRDESGFVSMTMAAAAAAAVTRSRGSSAALLQSSGR